MKRRSYLVMGAGAFTALAGCNDSTNGTPQNTTNDTPTSTPESTPEENQLQEEELPEEEINRLTEAFEIELTRSGFDIDSAELSDGYLTVVYYPAIESVSSVFSQRLQITQIYSREVLQQGLMPEFLQIWASDSDIVDIQTEWVLSWGQNRMTNGQFLAYTELDDPDLLTNEEMAPEACRFQLILSGLRVDEVFYGQNNRVRIDYTSDGERFAEILEVTETYQTEFLDQDISVPILEATVDNGEDYVIQREWVERWNNGEITTAGLLAYIINP